MPGKDSPQVHSKVSHAALGSIRGWEELREPGSEMAFLSHCGCSGEAGLPSPGLCHPPESRALCPAHSRGHACKMPRSPLLSGEAWAVSSWMNPSTAPACGREGGSLGTLAFLCRAWAGSPHIFTYTVHRLDHDPSQNLFFSPSIFFDITI